MADTKSPISEQALLYILLIAIAVLVVAIYNDYSVDLFNQFEYAMAQTLGNANSALAVK